MKTIVCPMWVLGVALLLSCSALAELTVEGTPDDLHVDIHVGPKKAMKVVHSKAKEGEKQEVKPSLSKEDEKYIDELVANVTALRKKMDASGLTETMLRSRLEGALLEQRTTTSPALAPSPSASGKAGVVCPPPGFDAITSFSIEDYISASWYIQQQMLVSYQPPNSLYCVKATYIPVDPKNLTAGLKVYNFANTGGVNESPTGPDFGFFSLRARIYNVSAPSKLAVGPYFSGPLAELTLGLLGLTDVPTFFTGPYWVVAAGPKTFGDPDFKGYEWAIVSGGPPTTKSNGACKTGNNLPYQLQYNGIGYWYLTRAQVASKALLAEMEAVGTKLGFDNSVLLPVVQEGCTYEGSVNVP